MAVLRLGLLFCLALVTAVAPAEEPPELPPALYENTAELPAALQPDVEFLPVDQAFQATISQDQDGVRVDFKLADGYYLYRDKLTLESLDPNLQLSPLRFSRDAKIKEDAYFGEVAVFYGDLSAQATVEKANSGDSKLRLSYQGCADAGLCYPPEFREFDYVQVAGQTSTIASTSPSNPSKADLDTESASSLSTFLSQSSLPLVLLMFFALGIGLAFTPCVFPMIPILSGIIAGQKQLTTTKAFTLSLSYVLGMAITYALLGVLVGSLGAGANIQAYMQEPWVLLLFAALFVALALAMFDFYQLQLPARLRDKLSAGNANQQGGTIAGTALMGVLSAVVVSPCVSAPLAGALLYISTTGDALLGGLALLALGLGMGAPLILIGTGSGRFLPRAGVWMESVKVFFGVALLAVAIWLLERILSPQATLLLWALLTGIYAVYLGAFDTVEPVWTGWQRFKKGMGLMLFSYSLMLLAGALSGGENPLRPLAGLAAPALASDTAKDKNPAKLNFNRVTSLPELEAALSQAQSRGQAAFIDVYADWCISCKVMEREVLNTEDVSPKLSSLALIKMDVTETNAQTRALLDRYGLFGPPAYLFLNGQGEELRTHRIMGEMKKSRFLAHLEDTGLLY